MNHHRALGYCLSMIFSENRFALFRIMLEWPRAACGHFSGQLSKNIRTIRRRSFLVAPEYAWTAMP
jgi:hypothetical protein